MHNSPYEPTKQELEDRQDNVLTVIYFCIGLVICAFMYYDMYVAGPQRNITLEHKMHQYDAQSTRNTGHSSNP